MMRLTTNNILFVKELTVGGMPYCWFVSMKSNCVSDAREYKHIDDRGFTICKEYPRELLPKCVRVFIESSYPETLRAEEQSVFDPEKPFVEYIYR